MSNPANIFIIVFVSLFSMVAVVLIIIMVRGIGISDKRIQKEEHYQQQNQNLLYDIHKLENKVPEDSTPNKIYDQLDIKRKAAAENLRQMSPSLDERLSFYQVDEDLGQLQNRMDHKIQDQESFICHNCGSKVKVGDKFCANCGFRLQG